MTMSWLTWLLQQNTTFCWCPHTHLAEDVVKSGFVLKNGVMLPQLVQLFFLVPIGGLPKVRTVRQVTFGLRLTQAACRAKPMSSRPFSHLIELSIISCAPPQLVLLYWSWERSLGLCAISRRVASWFATNTLHGD